MNKNWLWDRKISDAHARKALREPGSREFVALAALLLSRRNEPRQVFTEYLDPLVFCQQWASIKRRMRQDRWNEPRIIFWQAIYEKLADKYRKKGIALRREAPRVKEPLCLETGKAIRAIRREHGLSQKRLAHKMGVSQQLISRIEKGGENVSLTTLTIIARALDRNVEIRFVN